MATARVLWGLWRSPASAIVGIAGRHRNRNDRTRPSRAGGEALVRVGRRPGRRLDSRRQERLAATGAAHPWGGNLWRDRAPRGFDSRRAILRSARRFGAVNAHSPAAMPNMRRRCRMIARKFARVTHIQAASALVALSPPARCCSTRRTFSRPDRLAIHGAVNAFALQLALAGITVPASAAAGYEPRRRSSCGGGARRIPARGRPIRAARRRRARHGRRRNARGCSRSSGWAAVLVSAAGGLIAACRMRTASVREFFIVDAKFRRWAHRRPHQRAPEGADRRNAAFAGRARRP